MINVVKGLFAAIVGSLMWSAAISRGIEQDYVVMEIVEESNARFVFVLFVNSVGGFFLLIDALVGIFGMGVVVFGTQSFGLCCFLESVDWCVKILKEKSQSDSFFIILALADIQVLPVSCVFSSLRLFYIQQTTVLFQ